jgi:hypothetical protein
VKIIRKISVFLLALAALLTLWFFTEERDYLKADFNDVSETELKKFVVGDPKQTFISHFGDTTFAFPRQSVDKVKLFSNQPLLSSLTAKTLEHEFNDDLITFFNDTTNFHWGETTWTFRESEYILRFYSHGKVVGKIYLCLDQCGMVNTRPFTPNVKFGGLSQQGQEKIEHILNDPSLWN